MDERLRFIARLLDGEKMAVLCRQFGISRKSSGSESTFSNDLTDPADIEAGVQAMADEVWAWCEKARAFGRTVTVKIKYADFRQATRSRPLPAIVMSQDALRDSQHRPRADGVSPSQRHPTGRRYSFEL
jgi:nucleotidyltransferase/DNA polymerase involved in DNA repair